MPILPVADTEQKKTNAKGKQDCFYGRGRSAITVNGDINRRMFGLVQD
jgi:hypothetical protein